MFDSNNKRLNVAEYYCSRINIGLLHAGFFDSTFRDPMFLLYPIVKKKIWIISRMTRSMMTPAIPKVQIRTYLNPHLAILIGYVNKNVL